MKSISDRASLPVRLCHSPVGASSPGDGCLALLSPLLRQRDDGLVARLYRVDVEQAAHLESAGDVLASLRRFEAVVSTFEGLHDVTDARQQAARLAAGSEVTAARQAEQKWDTYEASYRHTMNVAFSLLHGERPASVRQLRVELRLAELQERARSSSYAGVVARRILETLLTQTSFYLNRDFFARQDFHSAAKVLTVASEIRPERSDVWYNLACALAHTGSKKKALAALDTAVARGFANVEQLMSDPDLASLRGEAGFQQLVARLRE